MGVWKSAEIGLFRPFSAFFALFRRAWRAPGKSRKRRKKAFFLRYPRISLNPHLLNPHLRHPDSGYFSHVSAIFPPFPGWTKSTGLQDWLPGKVQYRDRYLHVQSWLAWRGEHSAAKWQEFLLLSTPLGGWRGVCMVLQSSRQKWYTRLPSISGHKASFRGEARILYTPSLIPHICVKQVPFVKLSC